jgi:hypothetical protein
MPASPTSSTEATVVRDALPATGYRYYAWSWRFS